MKVKTFIFDCCCSECLFLDMCHKRTKKTHAHQHTSAPRRATKSNIKFGEKEFHELDTMEKLNSHTIFSIYISLEHTNCVFIRIWEIFFFVFYFIITYILHGFNAIRAHNLAGERRILIWYALFIIDDDMWVYDFDFRYTLGDDVLCIALHRTLRFTLCLPFDFSFVWAFVCIFLFPFPRTLIGYYSTLFYMVCMKY